MPIETETTNTVVTPVPTRMPRPSDGVSISDMIAEDKRRARKQKRKSPHPWSGTKLQLAVLCIAVVTFAYWQNWNQVMFSEYCFFIIGIYAAYCTGNVTAGLQFRKQVSQMVAPRREVREERVERTFDEPTSP